MMGITRRLALVVAAALTPLAFVSPVVSKATVCGAGTLLDTGSDTCIVAGPPPPLAAPPPLEAPPSPEAPPPPHHCRHCPAPTPPLA
ncbi:MAG: hypothetical protein JOZ49_08405, partial [Mycolicibacterium sp.]|nr:hypothetical protein [Mycolicibacterium sp.]